MNPTLIIIDQLQWPMSIRIIIWLQMPRPSWTIYKRKMHRKILIYIFNLFVNVIVFKLLLVVNMIPEFIVLQCFDLENGQPGSKIVIAANKVKKLTNIVMKQKHRFFKCGKLIPGELRKVRLSQVTYKSHKYDAKVLDWAGNMLNNNFNK